MNIQLPTSEHLKPWLDRLVREPDGVVIVAIQLSPNYSPAQIGWAFLSADERAALRKALLRVNRDRKAKGLSTTEEEP